MAKPYKEGSTWSIRVRVGGRDNYRAGFPSSKEAAAYAAGLAKSIRDEGAPQGKGPTKTLVAEALARKALEKLPTMKGAVQEGNRINRYLRLASLPILVVTPTGNQTGRLFNVVLERAPDERSIPNGLHKHRDALLTKTATSERYRAAVALTTMSEVTRYDLQEFMNRLREEGAEPATLDQERALLRSLFNHARSKWNWTEPGANPATGLDMPSIDNGRDRVLSMAEQERLDKALAEGKNRKVKPTVVMLRESAMRVSELARRARWKHVDWERKVLQVPIAKGCKRDVPLSPAAMAALLELKGSGEPSPDAFIVDMSYQAIKAAFKRAFGSRPGTERSRLRHSSSASGVKPSNDCASQSPSEVVEVDVDGSCFVCQSAGRPTVERLVRELLPHRVGEVQFDDVRRGDSVRLQQCPDFGRLLGGGQAVRFHAPDCL